MITLDKPEGLTPLQALDALRAQHPDYKDAVLSYAGRLDPMASGVLPVLVNEENKTRESYLGLDKEYEFQVLFGVGTDTHDILGIIREVAEGKLATTPHIEGTFLQEYPAYSSKTVNGVPLHAHARNDTLDEIEIPKKQVTIYSLENTAASEIDGATLLDTVIQRVKKVKGNFRQEEIIEKWRDNIKPENIFPLLTFKAKVSSGTYIRSLAVELGKQTNLPALAYSIRRIQVGNLTLKDCLSIVSED